MLGLDEVDPLPVPSSPAIMQQMPSVKIPLQRNVEWGVAPHLSVYHHLGPIHAPLKLYRLLPSRDWKPSVSTSTQSSGAYSLGHF